MKIILKPKKAIEFTQALLNVQESLKGEDNGMSWIYKTDKGTYTFFKGMGEFVFIQFEGKRRSFGRSAHFKIRRVKKTFGDDKIKMMLGDKEFEMTVTAFESSAPSKPFWLNCSKDEYRALQKLKAY